MELAPLPARSTLGPAPIVFFLWALSQLTWAVVGLAFWIPLMVRATAAVAVAVLYCAFTETDPEKASAAFHLAATFYARGFTLISAVFYPRRARQYYERGTAQTDKWSVFIMEILWTAVFWAGIVYGGVLLFRGAPAIPSIHARVGEVRFFEAPRGGLSPDRRLYETVFDSASTRYVNVELEMRHPSLASPVAVPITCRFRDPQGKPLAFQLTEVYRASAGDTGGTVLVGALGNEKAGAFASGRYAAECWAEGHSFSLPSFQIRG
ncbi:MAG TPA: hypothetical protein VFH27_15640 [Longimicrobiaceae bacterium]|nr:hypothetical protein [Longimicrobiaceae bacterium]